MLGISAAQCDMANGTTMLMLMLIGLRLGLSTGIIHQPQANQHQNVQFGAMYIYLLTTDVSRRAHVLANTGSVTARPTQPPTCSLT